MLFDPTKLDHDQAEKARIANIAAQIFDLYRRVPPGDERREFLNSVKDKTENPDFITYWREMYEPGEFTVKLSEDHEDADPDLIAVDIPGVTSWEEIDKEEITLALETVVEGDIAVCNAESVEPIETFSPDFRGAGGIVVADGGDWASFDRITPGTAFAILEAIRNL